MKCSATVFNNEQLGLVFFLVFHSSFYQYFRRQDEERRRQEMELRRRQEEMMRRQQEEGMKPGDMFGIVSIYSAFHVLHVCSFVLLCCDISHQIKTIAQQQPTYSAIIPFLVIFKNRLLSIAKGRPKRTEVPLNRAP